MKKVLVCVNRDFVLYNFRVELLERLLQDGYEVYICLPDGPKVKRMTDLGCIHISIDIDKRGTNPIRDRKLIKNYKIIFQEIKPDVILLYTTKVCIYGGIVAGKLRIPYIMNVSGLGTALEQKSPLQPLMIALYKMACKKAKCVFFQNTENQTFFRKHEIYKGRQVLIPGSGVNIDKWKYLEYPSDVEGVEFLFAARIIKEKGIEEYLYCAENIKKKYPKTTFHICGPCDGDYGAVLKEYEDRGVVKYHGEVQNTAEYMKRVHCLIHPSYYPEGISNVCLEAASCGRPVITTDRAGCRETVQDGKTGYVFKTRDRDEMVGKVSQFLEFENNARERMGREARKFMEEKFDRNIVVEKYLEEIAVEL